MSDLAVAHEHYPARGGGEVVADQLADAFDAPLVTGWVGDPDATRHDPTELLVNTPVERLRPLMGNPLVRDLFYMFAWESVPTLREYEVIIQSGNAPSWYVPDQDQTIVKYNHSTPRNPFDLFWRDSSHTAGWRDLLRPGYVVDRLYKKGARHLWKNRTDAVDLWVCNSEVVKHRTKKYLGVPEERLTVVYPPVNVRDYHPQPGGDYYLSLGRLAPSKHTATVAKAFAGTDRQLVIAGDGNGREAIEGLAGAHENITYRGFVPEQEKRELLEGAKALLFAAENEDFGMVPIEANAAGTPVIGVADGFTQYQIQDGENGYLFTQREPAHIRSVVDQFEAEGVDWSPDRMHRFAEQFGIDRFEREMREAVAQARERNQIESEISIPQPARADGGGTDR